MMERKLFEKMDKTEKEWKSNFSIVVEQKSSLQQFATKEYSKCMIGLLYGIMVDGKAAGEYYHDMRNVNTDGFQYVISCMQHLIAEKFYKLLENTQRQVIWLTREFINGKVKDTSGIVILLLRQICGGNASKKNCALAHLLVDLLLQHRNWVLEKSTLLPYVFQTFCRTAIDHGKLLALRKKEGKLCSILWHEKPNEVAVLGRELVRLLHCAKTIPEFAVIWKGIRSNVDGWTIATLMKMKTPKGFLQARLTKMMEDHLRFLMTSVSFGNQKRYQLWFTSKYLCHSESDTLLPDLVRYVCSVYHPTNDILASKVIQRWAIVGWLIKLCKRPENSAPIRLALMFDYLYFVESDNIMNIEPAILLMINSLRPYPALTVSLLEYLCFAVEGFAASPINCPLMIKGVSKAFEMLLKRGVVTSFKSIATLPKLVANPDIHGKLQRLFPNYFKANSTTNSSSPSSVDTVSRSNLSKIADTELTPQSTPSPRREAGTPEKTDSPIRELEKQSPKSAAYASNSPRQQPMMVKKSPVVQNVSKVSPSGRSMSPNRNARSSPNYQSPVRASPVRSSPVHKSPIVEQSDVQANENLIHGTFHRSNSNTPSPTITASSPGSPNTSEASYLSLETNGTPYVNAIEPRIVVIAATLSGLTDALQPFLTACLEAKSLSNSKLKTAATTVFNIWVKELDASRLAGPLGTLFFQALEHCWLSTLWNPMDAENVLVVLLKMACSATSSDQQGKFVPMLSAIATLDSALGIKLLLCCVSTCKSNGTERNFSMYQAFCTSSKHNDFNTALLFDLNQAEKVDLAWELTQSSVRRVEAKNSTVERACIGVYPMLCVVFPQEVCGKGSFLRFLCGHAVPKSLARVCEQLMCGKYRIFGKAGSRVFLTALEWECFEQQNLWEFAYHELFGAQKKVKENVLEIPWKSLFACVEPPVHHVALWGMLRLLSGIKPSTDLFERLLRLPIVYESLVKPVLLRWGTEHGALIDSMLITICKDVSKYARGLHVVFSLVRDAQQGQCGVCLLSCIPASSSLHATLKEIVLQDAYKEYSSLFSSNKRSDEHLDTLQTVKKQRIH